MINSLVEYYFMKWQDSLQGPTNYSILRERWYRLIQDFQLLFNQEILMDETYDKVLKYYSEDQMEDEVAKKLDKIKSLPPLQKLLKVQGKAANFHQPKRGRCGILKETLASSLLKLLTEQEMKDVLEDPHYDELDASMKDRLRESQIVSVLKKVKQMDPLEQLLVVHRSNFHYKNTIENRIIKSLSKEQVQSIINHARYENLPTEVKGKLNFFSEL